MRPKRWALGALLGVGVGLTGLVPGVGAEAVPQSREATAAVVRPSASEGRQIALMDFNAALQQSRPGAQPGYVASVDDPARGSVAVYVSGGAPLSDATRALARRYHVTVHAQSWPYSAAQLTSAAQALIRDARDGHMANLVATSVTVFDPAFPGITVSDRQDSAAATVKAERRTVAAAGVPVRFVPEQTAPKASRDNDYAPYNAGDFMFAFGSDGYSHYCTTGFAVRYQGHNYGTTAQHCRENGYRALDNESATFGRTKKYGGAGQVRMMTSSGSGLMWTGPWKAGSARRVVGAKTVSIGDQVCTSGANSGSHCGITITAVGQEDDGYSTATQITGMAKHGIAVIQGDSGGAVYVPISGTDKVYAVGMIQAMRGTALNPNCGDVYNADGNYCTTGVAFTPVKNILTSLGATLVTR